MAPNFDGDECSTSTYGASSPQQKELPKEKTEKGWFTDGSSKNCDCDRYGACEKHQSTAKKVEINPLQPLKK